MSGKISYSLARPAAVRKTKDCSLEPLTEVDEFERGVVDSNWCSRVSIALLWIVGVALVVSLVSVIVFVEFFYKWNFPLRIDCNLDDKLDFNRCLQRGCRYVVTDEKLPVCFFPDDHGYIRVGPEESTPDGFKLTLHRDSHRTLVGNEFDFVRLQVFYQTCNRIRFKFAPVNTTRYEATVLPVTTGLTGHPLDPLYRVTYQDGKPFGIKAYRNETGTVLFDSALPGMVLSDQFLQLSSRMATSNFFAFGRSWSKRSGPEWEKWTLFSRAHEDNNMTDPSVHPFYIVVEDDGKAHGVLLLNSNAMDMFVQPERAITFRTIGGLLDFYLLVGSSPADVVHQYLELVGRPFMPPQWALGPQTTISSETDPDVVPHLLNLLQSHGVSLSAIHIDSGYVRGLQMKNDVMNLTSHLSATGMKILLTADPLVNVTEDEKDLLILRNCGGSVDANIREDVAFIDFSNPKAVNYSENRCKQLYDDIKYDGLVLSSNEPSYPANVRWTPCNNNTWNEPPYAPGGFVDLFHRSVCGDTMQFGGRHYDLHNVYGHMHAEATWKATQATAPHKRSVIISSATFVGSGKYAGHLHHPSADRCSGEVIRASIIKATELSLVGIPYSGVEMPDDFAECSDTQQARWLQMVAFFPLYRFPLPRKLHDLRENASYFIAAAANATGAALRTRQVLVPYLYTLFLEASTAGSPVVRPLFYEFPQDPNVFRINQQFMLGPAILISPAADEEGDMEAYFPYGIWYEFSAGEAIQRKEASFVTLATFPNPHIHIRGGHIVPLQNFTQGENTLELFVAPDGNGSATGKIFFDDKETYRDDPRKNSQQMSFTFSKNDTLYTLTTTLESTSDKNHAGVVLGVIRICGIAKPSSIKIDGKVKTHFSVYHEKNVLHLHFSDLQPGNHTIRMTSPVNVY